ncbi:MAG TPA: hypothetical protein VGJ92_03475 [Methanocella sp.]|jgi:hypothetical protein
MQVNIDEYNMEYNCYEADGAAVQPRVVISISQDGRIFGEAHLHKISDLTCRNGPMVPDHKSNLVTKSFRIEDESKYYEACAQIVMDYIRRGFEVTYLKLI